MSDKENVLASLLSPDMIKVLYRGNYTIKQAGLYLGIGEEKVRAAIELGQLGVNVDDGNMRISRVECDRYLAHKTKYRKQA